MKRRDFLKTGLLAGVSTLTKPLQATTQQDVYPFELDEATIGELQRSIQDGSSSAVEITKSYLRRIEEIDRNGPTLRSVIEVNPQAMEIAASLDRVNKPRGPLHGIPVLIKDNIETGDQMLTTAGSLVLSDNRAKHDASIVRRMREAGAIILGKPTLVSGQTSVRRTLLVAGAGEVVKPRTPTPWIEILAEAVLDLGLLPPPTCVLLRSVLRPTDQ